MLNPNNKILLFGFYGRGNSGDDAMLYGIVKYLAETTCADIVIPSDISPVLPAVRNRVVLIPRNIVSILRAAITSDHLLIGGGSLFHTKGERLKFKIMVTRILFLGLFAKLFGNRVAFISAGIGPFENLYGKLIFKLMLPCADFINVRDSRSALLLREAGYPETKYSLTADFAYSIDSVSFSYSHTDPVRVAFNLLPYYTEYLQRADNEIIVDNIAGVIRRLLSENIAGSIDLVCFNNEADPVSGDIFLLTELKSRINSDRVRLVPYSIDPTSLLRELAGLRLFVTMRYHGIVYASIVGVPCIAVNYHPKCEMLVSELGKEAIKGVNIRILEEPETLYQCIKDHFRYNLFDSVSAKYASLIQKSFPVNYFK